MQDHLCMVKKVIEKSEEQSTGKYKGFDCGRSFKCNTSCKISREFNPSTLIGIYYDTCENYLSPTYKSLCMHKKPEL